MEETKAEKQLLVLYGFFAIIELFIADACIRPQKVGP